MAKVLGVGGVFFKCADADATRAWYVRVLGLAPEDYGGVHFNHSESAAAKGPGALTIFTPFAADSDYFAPSDHSVMINLMVDDLDGVLARAAAEGVAELQPRMDEVYGRFAWILDPDGRKIELWEPPAA